MERRQGATPARFPIIWQGATVGHLLVSPRRGDIELSVADRVLLADLAHQAGPAIHGVRLVADLQRLSANLQQSREQLILAREEERRRLRRDLHDDLAPTLAGLSLRAGTIGELIETDPPRAVALAEHLDAAIRDAVGNVRRLVYDLRPAALDDLGLLAAIRERALEYGSGPGTASHSRRARGTSAAIRRGRGRRVSYRPGGPDERPRSNMRKHVTVWYRLVAG